MTAGRRCWRRVAGALPADLPAAQRAAAAALELVAAALGAPVRHVGSAADGRPAVHLAWPGPAHYLDADVDADGRVEWYLWDARGRRRAGSRAPARGVPPAFAAAAARFAARAAADAQKAQVA